MNDIIERTEQITKLTTSDPILHIRLFDTPSGVSKGHKRGKWQLEVVFIGGHKATGLLTADEVTALESDLADLGWQVDASLFCGGFNAKPPLIEEFIFAMPDLWPDDLGLAEVTL